jgi:hypothetical protein
MTTPPSTQDEIAQLRHEERLVRAVLVGAARAHLGARCGVAAIRVPRLLS